MLLILTEPAWGLWVEVCAKQRDICRLGDDVLIKLGIWLLRYVGTVIHCSFTEYRKLKFIKCCDYSDQKIVISRLNIESVYCVVSCSNRNQSVQRANRINQLAWPLSGDRLQTCSLINKYLTICSCHSPYCMRHFLTSLQRLLLYACYNKEVTKLSKLLPSVLYDDFNGPTVCNVAGWMSISCVRFQAGPIY